MDPLECEKNEIFLRRSRAVTKRFVPENWDAAGWVSIDAREQIWHLRHRPRADITSTSNFR
jgi:hypothetical protein